ncbi:hypothetical protein Glove_87g244 [Diversispora epigaea]|uniref:Actin-like ATPase domain-containing protein n=1 Tax=Diversispora epigaea TaxID=1348612 RepID=A0A397J6X1_9GLOM|nr:hypothetical protein Glove_87g244 [Diversispora epigaea]
MPLSSSDVRVVVGIDFGTKFSGFTYCHLPDGEYTTYDQWIGESGQCQFKTNTVLQYDETLNNVTSWGYTALSKRPNRRIDRNEKKYIAELFKLHLGDLKVKPPLPVDDYKKVITDYLREFGKLIKATINSKWDGIDFMENVVLVIPVPSEYSDGAKAVMRKCAYDAELIDDRLTEKLQFITESEAKAIYCMDNCLTERDLERSGTTFMIVDCGGGTVDLTTRKLLAEKQLGEITERCGDFCGSTFIDDQFIKYLRMLLGNETIDSLIENYYGQLQYLVQEFCQHAKMPFTGDDIDFSFELDLENISNILLEFINDNVKQEMENIEWLIKLDYETIKSMFDPVIQRILGLINTQLENSREECSIMLLVGGFSQSQYLQKRVREKFIDRVNIISVPTNPINAVSHGAAIYGSNFANMDDKLDMDGLKFVIESRVLKFTYGIKILSVWKEGDPIDKKHDSVLFRFKRIAKRGEEAKLNQVFFQKILYPAVSFQTCATFEIYYTRESDAKFCDEPGMFFLGELKIYWPDVEKELERPTTFSLSFGKMEIIAKVKNELNGQIFQTTFGMVTEI